VSAYSRSVPQSPTAAFAGVGSAVTDTRARRLGWHRCFEVRIAPSESSPFWPRAPALFHCSVCDCVRFSVNAENCGNADHVRVGSRPTRAAEGRWTVDEWAPLDGRVLNAANAFEVLIDPRHQEAVAVSRAMAESNCGRRPTDGCWWGTWPQLLKTLVCFEVDIQDLRRRHAHVIITRSILGRSSRNTAPRRSDRCCVTGAEGAGQGREAPTERRAALTRVDALAESPRRSVPPPPMVTANPHALARDIARRGVPPPH
jgi:hypothetical protein